MSHVRIAYRFAAIPEWILYHPNLTATAVRVYGCLARHGTDPEDCYPSHARIAKFVGIVERSVPKPLEDLKAVGAIRIQARYVPDENDLDERGRPKVTEHKPGRQTSNGYYLAGDAPIGGTLRSATPYVEERTSPRADKGTPPYAQERSEGKQEEREPKEREKTGVAHRSAAVPANTSVPDPPREEVIAVTKEDREKARAALAVAKKWSPPDDHVALRVVSDG